MSIFGPKFPEVFIGSWYGNNINIGIEKSKITLVDSKTRDVALYSKFEATDFHGGINFISVLEGIQIHKINILPFQAVSPYYFDKILVIGHVDIKDNAIKRFRNVLIKKDEYEKDSSFDKYLSVNEMMNFFLKRKVEIQDFIKTRVQNSSDDFIEMLSIQQLMLSFYAIICSKIFIDDIKKEFARDILLSLTGLYNIGQTIAGNIDTVVNLTNNEDDINEVGKVLTIAFVSFIKGTVVKSDYEFMMQILFKIINYIS